jgi:hypothetical protein
MQGGILARTSNVADEILKWWLFLLEEEYKACHQKRLCPYYDTPEEKMYFAKLYRTVLSRVDGSLFGRRGDRH